MISQEATVNELIQAIVFFSFLGFWDFWLMGLFLVFFQHRFYGESMPFGKDSYNSAETVGYLDSQQALADYAVLIRSLKQNLSSEASPVVVFGGSYGGSKLSDFELVFLLFSLNDLF